MSEEDETFVVSMKVKDMPINPIPSMKLMCSGGCGDEVWVDKKLERLWSMNELRKVHLCSTRVV